MRLHVAFATVGAVVVLAGCATVDDGPFPWSKGWRKGVVLEVARPADMASPRFFRCVREAEIRDRQAVFVVVKYLQRGRAQRAAARISAGSIFEVGDQVYVNVGDCAVPAQKGPRPTGSIAPSR